MRNERERFKVLSKLVSDRKTFEIEKIATSQTNMCAYWFNTQFKQRKPK